MSKEAKKVCKTSIGGQAVIEGVMMRGASSSAVAVRDQNGKTVVESYRNKPRGKIYKVPILRGIVNFVLMLIYGTKVLMRSAEVYGDEEPSEFEIALAKKFKVNLMSVVLTISLFLGLLLAVGLFILLPTYMVKWIQMWTGITFTPLQISIAEGILKLSIFIIYLLLCLLMKDVRRVFMYHGAEHKTISCFEAGDELTVENVKKHSKIHDRCGTTFIFIVLFISIIAAIFIPNFSTPVRVLCKLACLPIVAGVSYEILKFLAKFDNPFVKVIKAPGLALQLITTRHPTDDMIEVAITAFKTVLEMDADPTKPTVKFQIEKRLSLTRLEMYILISKAKADEADIDWILVDVLGVKRDELKDIKFITTEQYDKAIELAKKRGAGEPVQYVLGSTEFYGIKLKTDRRALIPRFDTELVAEQAIKYADADKRVLDLCTGSGAIAIAVKAKTDASVTASDISEDALSLAKENARNLNLDINFIKSDMFENIDGRFDVIVSNPPYIPSGKIKKLDKAVKDYEPICALDGGTDGLDFYRVIADNFRAHLNENGVLVTELGAGEAESVRKLFENYETEIIKDYSGTDRILIVKV